MIKNFIFDNEVNQETVYSLIEAMDNFLADNQRDDVEVNIYFSTPGGYMYTGEILIDYLNNYPLELTLTLTNECCSCGIFIAGKTSRNLKILPHTWGMIHMPSIPLGTREQKVSGTTDYFYKTIYVPEMKKQTLKFYEELGLTDKELKIIKEGKDFYLSNEKLSSILIGYREKTAKEEAIKELEEQLEILKNIGE